MDTDNSGGAQNSAPQLLEAGIRALNLKIGQNLTNQLLDFIALLEKWNKTYNLTAIRDPVEMVRRHLLDSLVVRPFLHGSRIADVGTGAGIPGIPLAIVCPDKQFTLIDSAGKKIRFVRHAVMTQKLANVMAEKARLPDYRPASGFDTVLSRAFAPLPRMLDLAGHLCGDGGQMLAMKGEWPAQELDALPENWQVIDTVAVTVPSLDAQRHLIRLQRVAPDVKG